MAMTSHVAWGDPVNHPWTTGAPLSTYSTEAVLWGSFIEQHLSEFPTYRKIKVASLVQNNDCGKLCDASFKAYLNQSDKLKSRVKYFNETIEAAAPTVTDPMTTLTAKNADAWITMLAGTQCTPLALRSIDMTAPMLLPGIRLHMDGLTDAYPVEDCIFQKWDPAKQTYVNQRSVIDLDGKAKPWVPGTPPRRPASEQGPL
jgi:hypothetical protein